MLGLTAKQLLAALPISAILSVASASPLAVDNQIVLDHHKSTYRNPDVVDPAADAPAPEIKSLLAEEWQKIQGIVADATKGLGDGLALGLKEELSSLVSGLSYEGRNPVPVAGGDDWLSGPSWHGPPGAEVIDFSDLTIYEILNATANADVPDRPPHPPHHGWPPHVPHPPPTHPKPENVPVRKLAWVVNHLAEEGVIDLLNDEGQELTLLAPDDFALRPPHGHERGHGHGEDNGDAYSDAVYEAFGSEDLAEMLSTSASGSSHPLISALNLREGDGDGDRDEEKERRRKIIKHVVTVILKYHVLVRTYDNVRLADASTVPTALTTTKEKGGEHFRVRVEADPGIITIPGKDPIKFNFYARKRGPSIKAKNGIIHFLGAPLLPPLTPLSQLLLFPNFFSTLTSGVQQVELDSVLAPWIHGHDGEDDHDQLELGLKTFFADDASDDDGDDRSIDEGVFEIFQELIQEASASVPASAEGPGSREFTIFAPTNYAFKKLGLKPSAFLFSPFGKRLLKKVLQYHIVPDITFHSDYIHFAKPEDGGEELVRKNVEMNVDMDPSFENEFMGACDGDDSDYEGKGPGDWRPPHFPHPPHPPPRPTPPGQANITHYLLPTLLTPEASSSLHHGCGPPKGNGITNNTLPVSVAQYRLRLGTGPLVRRVVVEPFGSVVGRSILNPKQRLVEFGGKVAVKVADGVAWGGAVHPVDNVFVPYFDFHKGKKPDHDHDHDGGDHVTLDDVDRKLKEKLRKIFGDGFVNH